MISSATDSALFQPRGRVLLVTPHYPPHRLGGTELRAQRLAHSLEAHGLSVTVVCVETMSRGDHDVLKQVERGVYEGIAIHRLHLTGTGSLTGLRHRYDHPGVARYVAQLVKEWRPDVIHLISGYLVTACAIEVAQAAGIPVVVTLTDYWFICPRINLIRSNGQSCTGPHDALDCTRCLLSESRRYRLPEKLLPAMASWAWRTVSRHAVLRDRIPLYHEVARRGSLLVRLLNSADAVIIPTNSLRPRLARAGVEDRFWLSRHSLVLAEAGIKPDRPKPKSNGFRFGYMGQVFFAKGVDLLVKAYLQLARENENISLMIWGDTDSQPEYVAGLEKLLRTAPGAAIEGRYEPSQVGSLLQEIDVLVVPSRWPEIGPFTVLEAFATRTPVIAARIGNMPELVQHGANGLLFEPDSIPDLAAQMGRVLAEPGLYGQLQAGIPPVRTQSEEMADILKVYSNVTGHEVGRLSQTRGSK